MGAKNTDTCRLNRSSATIAECWTHRAHHEAPVRARDTVLGAHTLSAVLLDATRLRLATTPLSQATEVAQARAAIGRATETARQPQNLVCAWAGRPRPQETSRPPRSVTSGLLLPS